MAIRVVRLGSPRLAGEGIRIGTVRRPPRGVAKSAYAARDFYDVWLPALAPSAELVKMAQSGKRDNVWSAFVRGYRAEMRRPDASRVLDVLAALSHDAAFAVGCYCAEESRCHRAVLRALLAERGALLA